MKNKIMKERIENCLIALNFDTDRMSSSGNEAYRELTNIVIELYNDNLKQQEIIEKYQREDIEEEAR